MSRGRDMNVFSTMSAVICVVVVSWRRRAERYSAYSLGITIGEVDCDGASDGLTIQDLQSII